MISRSLALAVVATAMAGLPLEAQTLLRVNRSPRHASVDLATGVVTRGPTVRTRGATTVADFTDLDLAGFVGVDTVGCEWIDRGTKGFAGNASDLMSGYVLAYCSVVADVASGGPGSSLVLGFYEGYSVGGPAPTTAVAVFNLAGLPGHTDDSSYIALVTGSGGMSCYVLDVDLADCIAFADGPIGYSWQFTFGGTDLILGGTFPFLSCVQSCSGVGPDGQGMVDQIDQYCPPGNLLNTFSFGTTPFGRYFTSIAMEIREVADSESVATSWNGGVNVDCLTGDALTLGTTAGFGVLLADAHGPGGPMTLNIRPTCIDGTTLTSPIGGRAVEILATGPRLAALSGTHDGVSGTFGAFLVPPDATLLGLPWAAQATIAGGGFADLSTARCGTIGSVDLASDPSSCP